MVFKNLYVLVVVASLCIASTIGRNDNRAGAPGDQGTCANCHGGAATNQGTVELLGLPAEFSPGQTYDFQIAVNEPAASGGALTGAGFQLVATNAFNNLMQGSFTVVDAGTRINSTNRLVQDGVRNYSGNQAVWDVRYTTPNNPAAISFITFYYAGNSVNGNGSTTGDVVYTNVANVVLPVEWQDFSVEETREGNYVNWSTAIEINNDHFVVEKSRDGENFLEIAKISGQGNSVVKEAYEFLDREVESGMNYYRIKQVDFDGQVDYSSVLSLMNDYKGEIKVYPTIVESEIFVEAEDVLQVNVLDAMGATVLTRTNHDVIHLGDLSSGTYFIQLLDAKGMFLETRKIVKK